MIAPHPRPKYEDGLRIIEEHHDWPKTTAQLSDLIGSTPRTVNKALRSLIKQPPHGKYGAFMIWTRMNLRTRDDRYMAVLGYDPLNYESREAFRKACHYRVMSTKYGPLYRGECGAEYEINAQADKTICPRCGKPLEAIDG